ncbi:hypothetical protein [Streptomyces sp. RG80]|uniref:hypothetical protein n=1 Tax=Streptomyces sp. RG80 TaxID=3157340 RepID=UPI00338DECFF
MTHNFRKPTLPHRAEFLTLPATIYCSDRLYSPTVADRFATRNKRARPLPFTLASIALLAFCVMPGAGRLWKTLRAWHDFPLLLLMIWGVVSLTGSAGIDGPLLKGSSTGSPEPEEASESATHAPPN